MLYIDPEVCIDCGACITKCPVQAIFEEDDLPDGLQGWIAINAEKAAGLPVCEKTMDPLRGAAEKKSELGF
jgi:ferredoxin